MIFKIYAGVGETKMIEEQSFATKKEAENYAYEKAVEAYHASGKEPSPDVFLRWAGGNLELAEELENQHREESIAFYAEA